MKSGPQPLAIYIHWPFCKSKCPYCDFNSHVRESVEDIRWRKALLDDILNYKNIIENRVVTSIFFGGGTPSLMPPETVQALLDCLRPYAAPDLEVTLEANPTSVEAEKFRAFRAAGVNRLSLGIQSLNEESLRFLGRQHNAAEAKEAIRLAAKLFDRYSFDLIYALPNQPLTAWEMELREALAMAGGHISLYQLTIEENTAFHHAYARGDFTLPDEDEAAKLYELTQSVLEQAGMQAYEVSNYAKPGEESRHNLAYWRYEDYLGIGPGAHGRYRDLTGTRYATQGIKSPEIWLSRMEAEGGASETVSVVSPEAAAEEMLMMGLRLSQGIQEADFSAKTGLDFASVLDIPKCNYLTAQGLLRFSQNKLIATQQGRLVLNKLIPETLKN